MGEAKMVEHRSMVAKGYRDRLLKTLRANDIFKVLRKIGQSGTVTNGQLTGTDLEGRVYLLMHWSEHIRDRVLEIIARNIELDITR